MKNILLTLLLTTLSFSTFSTETFPEINNYWLRAAPPNASMMAAYGELTNNTDKDIVLVDAYSPAFNMTMIHQTKIVDGIAKMLHQDELIIKPKEKLVFKPGSFHIMLMHPNFKINVGDKIKINLIYKNGEERKVQEIWFPVEKR